MGRPSRALRETNRSTALIAAATGRRAAGTEGAKAVPAAEGRPPDGAWCPRRTGGHPGSRPARWSLPECPARSRNARAPGPHEHTKDGPASRHRPVPGRADARPPAAPRRPADTTARTGTKTIRRRAARRR
ncbi:hypothetical protein GCM10018793_51270 [Streptomyces sulfonofaciens]|uniref:Uncharacterized protein n=1 Tax=Streptomyces sulfonofaciens TaxID=68272 RepID=A0A919L6Y7_9ACTN|nr:hypothetical protein GCM10018793_51270 [Streptomyces sulfonofaciens]